MRIMALGDITDPESVEYIAERLWEVRREKKIDFVVANAENASFINGASAEQMRRLCECGVDVVTGGNHTMQNRAAHTYLEESTTAIRPINYPAQTPGMGYTIADSSGYRAMVINALGKVNMEPNLDCPFTAVERALCREAGNYDFAILDFHAEAVGEKMVMPHLFDGRISIIFGTHTHLRTADARIFPKGCGYITDIGMCGHSDGIIGSDSDCIIERIVKHMPAKYVPAAGDIVCNATVFTLDDAFRCERIDSFDF
ncbi:MAG: TIGR00282 family metallophosphoesterase [Eubacteriales bacterium]|nr:TIGR00282 family metallophosphoesterase [Eubacteriales bacterium]